MKKQKKLIALSSILLMWVSFFSFQSLVAQNEATIGTGTSTTNGLVIDPVDVGNDFIKGQIIFTAAELSTAGMTPWSQITALGFSISQPPGVLHNYQIRMGNCPDLNLSGLGFVSDLHLVKEAFDYTPTYQTNEYEFDMIQLDHPFIWDGVSSVILDICTGPNTFAGTYGGVRYTPAANSCLYTYSLTGSVCSNSTGGVLNERPNVRFEYAAADCSPITSLPWSENFDSMGAPGYPIGNNIVPTCWKTIGYWNPAWPMLTTWLSSTGTTYHQPLSTNYVVCFFYPNYTNKYFITPGFLLESGYNYVFSFDWVGDGYNGWTASTRINNQQSGIGSIQLGNPFLTQGHGSGNTYQTLIREFIPDSTGIYYFMIHVYNNDSSWELGFDNFQLKECRERQLNLTLLLEGLYEVQGDSMRRAQNDTIPAFGPGIADKIIVELHNPIAPYESVYADTIDLMVDGSAIFTTPTTPCIQAGDYYIVIKHRNSIETWSATPVSFDADTITYDFSISASQAYGSNLKQRGNRWLIFAGDVDQNGIVDASDMMLVDNENKLFSSGYLPEDVSGDGIVDLVDMLFLDNNSRCFIEKKRP